MITSNRLLLIGGIVMFCIVGGLVLQFQPTGLVTDMGVTLFTPVSGAMHFFMSSISILAGGTNLVEENMHLRGELEKNKANAARIAALQEEITFLKSAAHISDRLPATPIAGNIFSYARDGGVRQLMINRGSRDRVGRGDIVVTSHGALVGSIWEVAQDHALVRVVGDPSLEITARILNSEVSGLVRVDARQGLMLDLVKKSETVTEGETIVTSGNDQFPAGFVIGTVRSVDNDSATLFTIVRIAPAIDWEPRGHVLIIRP